MNLIDKVINNLHTLSADDVIEALTKIYDEPIERAELDKYPQFIQDIIFIIDFDTELSMEGIGGVLENSIADKIIIALRNIHADSDADLLQKIVDIYDGNLENETIDKLADQLYLYSSLDIWELLNIYVNKEKQAV